MKLLRSIFLLLLVGFFCIDAQEEHWSYYDMGKFNIWDFLEWDNEKGYEVVSSSKEEQFFSSLGKQLKESGFTGIYLAFGQMCNIDAYASGQFLDRTLQGDVVGLQIQQLQEAQKKGSVDPKFSYLEWMINSLHKQGLQVAFSFGGVNSSLSSFIPPENASGYLLQMIEKYGLEGIDLDVEIALPPSTVELLTSMINQVNAARKSPSLFTLTLLASLTDNKNLLGMGFWLENASSLFKGINLMAYSETEYYIDADNPSWGIKEWIKEVKDAHLLRIGFYDAIAYEKSFGWDSTQRGKSARIILDNLCKALEESGYCSTLGGTFWWPDEGMAHHHYDSPDNQGDAPAFISAEQSQFYSTNS